MMNPRVLSYYLITLEKKDLTQLLHLNQTILRTGKPTNYNLKINITQYMIKIHQTKILTDLITIVIRTIQFN